MIDGDGNALVADVGQQLDRVEQVVVRHSVRVVTEEHSHPLSTHRPTIVVGITSTATKIA